MKLFADTKPPAASLWLIIHPFEPGNPGEVDIALTTAAKISAFDPLYTTSGAAGTAWGAQATSITRSTPNTCNCKFFIFTSKEEFRFSLLLPAILKRLERVEAQNDELKSLIHSSQGSPLQASYDVNDLKARGYGHVEAYNVLRRYGSKKKGRRWQVSHAQLMEYEAQQEQLN